LSRRGQDPAIEVIARALLDTDDVIKSKLSKLSDRCRSTRKKIIISDELDDLMIVRMCKLESTGRCHFCRKWEENHKAFEGAVRVTSDTLS
jgi:hypothetical protein